MGNESFYHKNIRVIKHEKTIWALMDDRAGSVGQAKGIFPVIEDEFEIIEKRSYITGWRLCRTCFAAKP